MLSKISTTKLRYLKITKLYYLFILSLMGFISVPQQASAQDLSMPFSGRLVEEDGKPVEGPVDLVVEFFDSKSGGISISDSIVFDSTPLTEGIFQIDITMPSSTFHSLFAKSKDSLWIQITDATNGSSYPRQQIAAVPMALPVPVDGKTIGWNADGKLELLGEGSASQISGTKVSAGGASNGQVLAWDNSSKTWKPQNPVPSGSIGNAEIADNSITYSKLNIPCEAGKGLQVNASATGFDCVAIGTGAGDINNTGNTTGAPITIGTDDTFALNLETDDDVRLTIDAIGNVGIGTTAPGSKLEVTGDISLSNGGLLKSSVDDESVVVIGASAYDKGPNLGLYGRDHATLAGNMYIDYGGYDGTGNIVFRHTQSNSTQPTRLLINSAGNVGIGTTSPQSDLHVEGTIRAQEVCDESGGNCKDLSTGWSALGAPPVGSIMAWHKDLTGVPALPGEWLECNGQVVADPSSTLDGQTLPDLNGEKRFLRGNSVSGTNQEATSVSNIIDNRETVTLKNTDGTDGTDTRNPNDMNGSGKTGTYYKVRPVNMSVVWIMRIK